MVNGGYSRETGNQVLEKGAADMVAFGSLFIANPYLPLHFKMDAELNVPDQTTYYGGDEKGYTDYPFLKEEIG